MDARLHALLTRREQLANFVYVSDFAMFSSNGMLLDTAVRLAEQTIAEIDSQIEEITKK